MLTFVYLFIVCLFLNNKDSMRAVAVSMPFFFFPQTLFSGLNTVSDR